LIVVVYISSFIALYIAVCLLFGLMATRLNKHYYYHYYYDAVTSCTETVMSKSINSVDAWYLFFRLITYLAPLLYECLLLRSSTVAVFSVALSRLHKVAQATAVDATSPS